MGLRAKLSNAAQWIGLFACYLSASIFLTINAIWLYRLNVHTQNLNRIFGLSVKTLMHNYYQLIAYLEFPWIKQLEMDNFPDSAGALFHFAQVKQLFLLNNIVLLVTLISSFFLLRRLKRQNSLWRLIIPMRNALWVPPLIAVVMVLNFQQFFITFHELLFRNSDWLFDPQKDPIILVLPDTFFMQCFAMAIILLEAAFGVSWWIGRRHLD